MAGARDFSLLQQVQTISGVGPCCLFVSEYQELFFPGAVCAGHEAEIENKWKCTSTLKYVCMACTKENTVLLLHR
jgi:hypothetical protein